ncbi:PORR domain-containing protein [Heracleum sosnowskyi]|uniref:PORR domain-containing protein n=1 Tax=Heracleum sosnowskyi TaxID=360622 RepID=A0AAD8IJU7_9APIA|nr:PORR domain-containing protein [Heracleum sosnowskyi]
MNWGIKKPLSFVKLNSTATTHIQFRTLVKVRLKWAKNKTLDNIIETNTQLKAAYLLKHSIVRSSTGFITSKSISNSHKFLGLTIPTLRFIRRYPTLFQEFNHSKYPSLPCFRLTEIAKNLHDQELRILEAHEANLVERLCKVLMMTRDKIVPFESLNALKWDLGLPDDFDRNLVFKYSDYFRVVKDRTGVSCLELLKWNDEFAVSVLQKRYENVESGSEKEFSKFRRGQSAMAFSLRFPRGYGGQNKVKAWMEEFQKLPYISPYEDSTGIDMNSDVMEKRIVGLLHEFLSLTEHKMTKRNYLGSLRGELNLPERFTRIYTRYPGIFYLSMKCKTTTVAVREGYRRGKLAEPSPLANVRGKFYYAMKTGLMYQNKGVHMLPELAGLSSSGYGEDNDNEGEKDETMKECNADACSDSEEEFDGDLFDVFGDGSL